MSAIGMHTQYTPTLASHTYDLVRNRPYKLAHSAGMHLLIVAPMELGALGSPHTRQYHKMN